MTKRTIDEFLVKITGKTPIDQKLILGEDVRLEIIGNTVKIETLDNQDGTVNKVYCVKPLEVKINN